MTQDLVRLRSSAVALAVEKMGAHRYGERPYLYHLATVEGVLLEHGCTFDYSELVPVLAAAWLHDIIEDTDTTYNDVRKATNEEVADIVYDVTDGLGKNRKERHASVVPRLRKNPKARMLKLADRLANMSESQGRMRMLYMEECADFLGELQDSDLMNFRHGKLTYGGHVVDSINESLTISIKLEHVKIERAMSVNFPLASEP